jgi:hypothetical protein
VQDLPAATTAKPRRQAWSAPGVLHHVRAAESQTKADEATTTEETTMSMTLGSGSVQFSSLKTVDRVGNAVGRAP